MKNIFTFLWSLLLVNISFGQTNIYLNEIGRVTTKDSAKSYVQFEQKEGKWQGKEFYLKGDKLKSEGLYSKMDITKPVGAINSYFETGSLSRTTLYNDTGKVLEATGYYKGGQKKYWISYGDKTNKEKGYDEEGKEIKNYVVEKEARFRGGMNGWRKYLEKNLNANVAADAGAPEGQYMVKVQFIVDKEGNVSNVKAIDIPAKCKPCAAEAVNVIANGPAWEAAIQYNEPVIYQAIQYITFVVVEESPKKRN